MSVKEYGRQGRPGLDPSLGGGVFLNEFFFPTRGIPHLNTQPYYIPVDFTTLATSPSRDGRVKFLNIQEPFVLNTVRGRYDDDTATPTLVNPSIYISALDQDPPLEGPTRIDLLMSPGEGNAFYESDALDIYIPAGRKGINIEVQGYESGPTRLFILLAGRKFIDSSDATSIPMEF